MKIKKYFWNLILLILCCFHPVFGDGLLMPNDEDYPADFLRNRVTEVTVQIDGLMAKTVVYQEFVNEWDKDVDAVYSFPLPENARSHLLLYTRNDTTFKAILKVQQQSTNPGTGEGGVAALVNNYIGRNGLKMQLFKIVPGAIQKIELHYISLLDFHQGVCSYKYPLDTKDFVNYPLDHLEFTFDVNTHRNILDYDIPSHSDYQVLMDEKQHLVLRYRKPQAFVASNLVFSYEVENADLGVDLYSSVDDSLGGHFALFVRPANEADSADIFSRNIVFVLCTSSTMSGYKHEQSIAAIKQILGLLSEEDNFNIINYNYYYSKWKNNVTPALPNYIQEAKDYLDGLTVSGGNRLDYALSSAIQQFPGVDDSKSIIAFTDGKSPLDPVLLSAENTSRIGIFPIAIGDDVDRSRLEMTAALNYGFVTYLDEEDNLKSEIVKMFEKIAQPILMNTLLNIEKADVYALIPQRFPTTFAGSYFFVAGRYKNPGFTQFIINGDNVEGPQQLGYQVNFNAEDSTMTAPKYIWAKETIDQIEREIDIYGETEALKDSMINLSLSYEIRCRYTAYIADYKDVWDITADISIPIDPPVTIPHSFIAMNYPNPFNPSTTIRFYLDENALGKVKLLKIYNVLGQLVAVIDITNLGIGWHELVFDGRDFQGNSLPAGVYFISLQLGNQRMSTLQINLVK